MVIVFPEKVFRNSHGKLRYGYYMDPILKFNIDNFLIRGVNKGHDAIGLVTGLEGSGKSTFAKAMAYYVDPTFNLSRIVFSGTALMWAIDHARPGQAIIFDEAIMDMSSQDFATDMQKILIKKFTLIRKKRLYIFLVIPSIFMLRKYFAIFRTRYMINCFCPDGITRGKFRFYSFASKKKLYLTGSKEMDMGAVRSDFNGNFTDTSWHFIDEDKYEANKDEAIRKLTQEKSTDKQKFQEAFEDYKLKLKIDVDKFKANWKEKFNALKNKYAEALKTEKTKASSKIEQIQANTFELQKSKQQDMVKKLTQENLMLKAFFYDHEKMVFEKNNWGKNFSELTFKTLLEQSPIKIKGLSDLKSEIAKGRELIALNKP